MLIGSRGDSRRRWLAVIAFILILAAILGYKAIDLGWFAARPPLALHGRPAILFFNKDRGCECELVVYQNADRQMAVWPEEARGGIPVIPINLEQRPDLAGEYRIVRAPALLLLNPGGQIIWRQDEAKSDLTPLDLKELERQIQSLQGQK